MLPISPSSLWSLYGTPHVELDLQKVCQPARLPLALKQQDIYSMDALPDDAEAAQQRLNTLQATSALESTKSTASSICKTKIVSAVK